MTYNDQSVFGKWMSTKWQSQNWELHSTWRTSSSTAWFRYILYFNTSLQVLDSLYHLCLRLAIFYKKIIIITKNALVGLRTFWLRLINILSYKELWWYVIYYICIVISIFMVKNHLMVCFFQDSKTEYWFGFGNCYDI